MISPLRSNGFGAVVRDHAGDSSGIHMLKERAMDDCFRKIPSSPLSPSSKHRSQGFPLSNSKTQLLRVNALYDDNGDQGSNRRLDYSQDYSLDCSGDNLELDKSREESDFYLNSCMSPSREDEIVASPLYKESLAFSSSSSTTTSSGIEEPDENDSDFLIEARKSLKALQEWQHFATIPSRDDDNVNSSCEASFNTSYGSTEFKKSLTIDTQSACYFNDFHSGKTPHSCPNFPIKRQSSYQRPSSTKLWLQEIKDEDFMQRKRIADAIAAEPSSNNASPKNRAFLQRIGSKSFLKTSTKKVFGNRESEGNDHTNEGWERELQRNRRKEMPKKGRQKLSRSTILSRTSWQNHPPLGRRKRRSSCKEDDEHRDDENDSNSSLAMDASTKTATTMATTRSEKNNSSTMLGNDKDLETKRALYGCAKVLTMDGIVESFADPNLTSLRGDKQNLPFAPRSDAPLTWV